MVSLPDGPLLFGMWGRLPGIDLDQEAPVLVGRDQRDNSQPRAGAIPCFDPPPTLTAKEDPLMASLPSFDKLKETYPNKSAEEVKTLIGAHVNEDYIKNACTLRVSRSLNYSGAPVPFIKDKEGKQQTLKGADGMWYIFRVKTLKDYLIRKYGNPSINIISKNENGISSELITGFKGIFGIETSAWKDATGHFTLWDGKLCVDGTNYFLIARKVMLWSVG
jgi:hypothetical protein